MSNPSEPGPETGPKTGAPLWQLAVAVPADSLDLFEAALAEEASALSWFEQADGRWRIEALFREKPAHGPLEMRIAVAARAAGIMPPAIDLAPLPDEDWIAKSLEGLSPVHAGRFYVHGSHDRGTAPPSAAAIEIDAGHAFGTGQHASTCGCLLAIERLARRRRIRRPLDLGTGTGVLAIAMAYAWRVPVTASDIDPISIAQARGNARRNRVASFVTALCADGLDDRRLRWRGPYDLIVANILARPLVRLAPSIRAHGAVPGVVVLAGILKRQERQVLNTYRSLGFRLEGRVVLGDWPTLILARGRRQATLR